MTKIGFWLLLAVLALLLALASSALAQQTPPHRFFGTVTIDGVSAPDGTRITAVVSGQVVASTSTSAGSYRIDVGQTEGVSFSGKSVGFTVGGIAATQAVAWVLGEATNLNLTVVSSHPATTLAPLGNNLVRVWGFTAATQSWHVYDPALAAISDLTELKRGQGYWIKVNTTTTPTLGTEVYTLVTGWNLIGWLGSASVPTPTPTPTPKPASEVFREQPSYSGDCRARPQGSVCISYQDGYIWLVYDSVLGWAERGMVEGRGVVAAIGQRYEYQHVLGTLLVRQVPPGAPLPTPQPTPAPTLAPTPSLPAVPAGSYRIQGTVSNAVTGKPEAGIKVVATTIVPTPSISGAQIQVIRPTTPVYQYTASTGANGLYYIDLPQGASHTIAMSKSCFNTHTFSVNTTSVSNVPLSPIQPSSSAPLAPDRYRVYGQLKNQSNTPITGACVAIRSLEQPPGGSTSLSKETPVGEYLTDANGFFYVDWPKWYASRLDTSKDGCEAASGAFLWAWKPPPPPGPTPTPAPRDPRQVAPDTTSGSGGPLPPYYGPTPYVTGTPPPVPTIQQDISIWCGPRPTATPRPVRPTLQPCQVNYWTLNVSRINIAIFVDNAFIGRNNVSNYPLVGRHTIEFRDPDTGRVIYRESLDQGPCGTRIFN